jgi:hypothetical protein
MVSFAKRTVLAAQDVWSQHVVVAIHSNRYAVLRVVSGRTLGGCERECRTIVCKHGIGNSNVID